MSLTRILSSVVVAGALLVAVPAQAKPTTTPSQPSVVRHETKKAHKAHKTHATKQLHAKATKKAEKAHKVA